MGYGVQRMQDASLGSEPQTQGLGLRVLYWGYIGIVEKEMETTLIGLHRV